MRPLLYVVGEAEEVPLRIKSQVSYFVSAGSAPVRIPSRYDSGWLVRAHE